MVETSEQPGSVYRIFPDVARNHEADILRELRKGWNVTIEFRDPVRIGALMVESQELARLRRIFHGSVSRPNPRRKAKTRHPSR
jgi:hypothetical protein